MEAVQIWCGMIGGWLLFVGPLYQAALELEEERFEHTRLVSAADRVGPPKRSSSWWWLLPPVKIVLDVRKRGAYQRALIANLNKNDMDLLSSFMQKARAWGFVGLGGLLLAIKHSLEFAQLYALPAWITSIGVLVIFLFLMSIVARRDRIASHESGGTKRRRAGHGRTRDSRRSR